MTNDAKRAKKARSDSFAGSPPSHAFDPAENEYWRIQYLEEVYFVPGMTYDDYEPAYRFGYESHKQYPGRKFDDIEHDMRSQWDKVKAKSRLGWEQAKHAVRATWDRLEHAVRGKSHAEHR